MIFDMKRWRVEAAVLGVLVLAACTRSPRQEAQPKVAPARGPAVAPPGVVDAAVAMTGPDAAPAMTGRLQPMPPKAALWADRACLFGAMLKVENDCGCGDAFLCNPTIAAPGVIDLNLRKDTSRLGHCLDCYPWEPGRCMLPTLTPGKWQVQVDGATLLELEVDASGKLPDPMCWSAPTP